MILDGAVARHNVGDAEEGGDVRAGVEVAADVELLGRARDLVVDARRRVLDAADEVLLEDDLLRGGRRDARARGHGRLERRVRDAEFAVRGDRVRRRREVARVDDVAAAGVREAPRGVRVDRARGREPGWDAKSKSNLVGFGNFEGLYPPQIG